MTSREKYNAHKAACPTCRGKDSCEPDLHCDEGAALWFAAFGIDEEE